MSAVAVDESHHVVEIAVSEVAPHPFNDNARAQPQPGDPKWDELLNGVRANGVRLPVLVVPRDTFTAARPGAAGKISPEARYVLIYGHRRRAAALEAGRNTMPAVIDDAIMADNGDLDAMAAENLGRQDLSDLAEADLFARYSEIGLTQRAIADRWGSTRPRSRGGWHCFCSHPKCAKLSPMANCPAPKRPPSQANCRTARCGAGRRARIPIRTPTNVGPNRSRRSG